MKKKYDLDLSQFSQEELDKIALHGIKKFIDDGSLPDYLLEMAKSMSNMEHRLKKLEDKNAVQ